MQTEEDNDQVKLINCRFVAIKEELRIHPLSRQT